MSICLTLSHEISNDEWKTNIPFYSGLGTEGIGSTFQFRILLSFYADFMGVDYTFSGTKDICHYSYTSYSQDEYCKILDKFFNFPNKKIQWDEVYTFSKMNNTFNSGDVTIFETQLNSFIEKNKNSEKNILINLHQCFYDLSNFCQKHVFEIFTKERVNFIKNNLVYNGINYFTGSNNICWHIRTSNPNDLSSEISSPYRELYVFERDFSRYKNLVSHLKNIFLNKKTTLHIHSQGFNGDFSEFLNLKEDNFDIITHIDEDPISDLYHMANSDLLIMPNSSFSWIAAMLNSNKIIVRDNWAQLRIPNFIYADYNYNLKL
jgi:hypothetical protein